MFTIRYVTDTYAPDLRIVPRTAADGPAEGGRP
jgi:hypothetical protein